MRHTAFLGFTFVGVLGASIAAQAPFYTFQGSAAGDRLGHSVSGAGDVNGDGFDDVIIGEPLDDTAAMDAGSIQVRSGLDGSVLYRIDGAAAADEYGIAVAGAGDVNGDGFGDFVVGAHRADPNGLGSGQVTVYSGQNGSVLHTFNGDGPGDRFGFAVNSAGDVNYDGYADIIVGAPQGPGTMVGNGYARVFSGIDGATLYTVSGDSLDDIFGRSVAAASDVNGDGFGDFVVGAPLDDNVGAQAGSIRVFSGSDGSTIRTVDGDGPNRWFGHSVDVLGDVNGDGVADLVVGQPLDDDNGTNSGSAVALDGANGNVIWESRGRRAGDEFGWAVVGLGDVDGDVVPDCCVTAPFRDTTAIDVGAALVMSGADATVLCALRGDSGGDWFGFSVGAAGDVNNDGYGDLVVGAALDDPNGLSSGEARVYLGDDCRHLEVLSLSPTMTDARFGKSLARVSDFDGDMVDDYIVGAVLDSAGGLVQAGSAHAYSGATNTVAWVFRGTTAGAFLGSAVGDAGDVDNDGVTDFVVGAWKDSTGGIDAGEVRIHSGKTGLVIWSFTGDSAGDLMGTAVAGLGDINNDGFDDVIIGLAGEGVINEGSVWVMSGVDGSRIYRVDGAANYEWFGFSVAVIGDINNDGVADFVAGGPTLTNPVSLPGVVRVISGVDGTVLFTLNGDAAGDGFGFAVGSAGDTDNDGKPDFIVGAPLASKNGTNSGFVRVFSGNGASVIHQLTGNLFDRFGRSVNGVGDTDGDGHDDFAVGAPGVVNNTGAVFVYSGRLGGPPLQTFLGDATGDSMGTAVVTTGDLNMDGRSDMIVAADRSDANGVNSGMVRLLQSVDLHECLDPPTCLAIARGGVVRSYGAPCPTSTGSLPRMGVVGAPVVGGGYAMTLQSGPALAGGLLSVDGVASNLSLAFINASGCTLLAFPVINIPVVTNVLGQISLPLGVPVDNSLVNKSLFAQWILLDGSANGLGIVFSDGGQITIGG